MKKSWKSNLETLICGTLHENIESRHIINTYIEGPFGGYDENNVGQEHLWRIVISVSRFVDGILTDRDVVFHMPDEKKADELHSTLVDILNC